VPPYSVEHPLFDVSVFRQRAGGMSWQEMVHAEYVPKGIIDKHGEAADTCNPDYMAWMYGVR